MLKEDFEGETVTKLSVICMEKIGKEPLTGFRDLTERERKRFNQVMNDYIKSLGECWKEKLQTDFNEVCTEEIFNQEFNPQRIVVRETNTAIELLRRPEDPKDEIAPLLDSLSF